MSSTTKKSSTRSRRGFLEFEDLSVGGGNGSSGGYVASRRVRNSASSWAPSQEGVEYQIPVLNHRDELSVSVSSPPRVKHHHGTRRRRRQKLGGGGTPDSRRGGSLADDATTKTDFSLPPELTTENHKNSNGKPQQQQQQSQESTFRSWLTSGVLDTLNVVAGVTLSTTGQLMAPPLQMTKTVLLPGLLALFVDTFDTMTPQRVKDWFRIISSSVYHVVSVLRSTTRGHAFSDQFVVVLQDLLHALSCPEARQVMVDGMATSVRLAEALHTPEMHALLEQTSILGCRLVDAAASGKSKQLMHDGKDLVWKAIEMATDPATTLALAEVTAHLCHALEDTQKHALNPTPSSRSRRNEQNQAVYLDPLQMSDYGGRRQQQQQHQASTEEIILNCLGLDDESYLDEEDDRSIPSKIVWGDESAGATTVAGIIEKDQQVPRDWKDRAETVNVDLLRERILYNNINHPAAAAAATTTTMLSGVQPKGAVGAEPQNLPTPRSRPVSVAPSAASGGQISSQQLPTATTVTTTVNPTIEDDQNNENNENNNNNKNSVSSSNSSKNKHGEETQRRPINNAAGSSTSGVVVVEEVKEEVPSDDVLDDSLSMDIGDLEDIQWDNIPTVTKEIRKTFLDPSADDGVIKVGPNGISQDEKKKVPSVVQFYRLLDGLMETNRSKRIQQQQQQHQAASNEGTTINNHGTRLSNVEPSKNNSTYQLRTQQGQQGWITKQYRDGTKTRLPANIKSQRRRDGNSSYMNAGNPSKFIQFIKKQRTLVFVSVLSLLLISMFWMGFAIFGMYMFIKVTFQTPSQPPVPYSPPMYGVGGTEIVIRIVKESTGTTTVDDSTITKSGNDNIMSMGGIPTGSGGSTPSRITDDEVQKVTECVASAFA